MGIEQTRQGKISGTDKTKRKDKETGWTMKNEEERTLKKNILRVDILGFHQRNNGYY